ncbi:MAG: PaaI family thioesterase [Chitinophagales bacterium]
MFNNNLSPTHFNEKGQGTFPGLLGITIVHMEEGKTIGEMPVKKELFAPNGFLHAGSVVTFADTIAGYSTVSHLPEKAKSFTTIELKSNFMGTAREGILECESFAEHLGQTTHVWRVVVKHKESQKQIAIFSCTQLILY